MTTPAATCDSRGVLRWRGVYRSREDMIRQRDFFAAEPKPWAHEQSFIAEIDAALARFEQIAIEEVGE